MTKSKKPVYNWRGWIFPALLIAVWHFTAKSGWGNTDLLATPWQVLQTAGKQLARPDFAISVFASIGRDLIGFLIGSLAGLAFGSWLGVSRWAESLFLTTFHLFRQIALFAWIPLITVWVGYTNSSRILLIVLSAFYPVALATFDGVRSVSRNHVEVARVLAFTRWQQFGKVILPAALPSILTGVNLALIYAWLATIGAEFLVPMYGPSAIGLGNTVTRARAGFLVDLILFSMLAIGLVGWGLHVLSRWLESVSPARRPAIDGGRGIHHDD